MLNVDVLIVGLGFSGATSARVLAEAGYRVHAIDRRPHIGGNAADAEDSFGIRIHRYGPHIFHTNSDRIFAFLSRFTAWRVYEHRVLASVDGELVPIPINRTTINRLYRLSLSEQEVADFLQRVREVRDPIRSSEDVVLERVGRDLCDKLFRGYTRKQWGLDLAQLDASVAGRIPVRTTADDRYFSDKHQGIPADGYTKMFQQMLEHPLISYEIDSEFAHGRERIDYRHLIYTGPIDAYFDFCYGRLPYRSLHFQYEHLPGVRQFQPVGTVNFPNEFEYTRITEFKHITAQEHSGTTIVREFPRADGQPYYPIPRPENEALYKRYRGRADSCVDATFVGRLAQYRYYNMDQAVGAAISAASTVIDALRRGSP